MKKSGVTTSVGILYALFFALALGYGLWIGLSNNVLNDKINNLGQSYFVVSNSTDSVVGHAQWDINSNTVDAAIFVVNSHYTQTISVQTELTATANSSAGTLIYDLEADATLAAYLYPFSGGTVIRSALFHTSASTALGPVVVVQSVYDGHTVYTVSGIPTLVSGATYFIQFTITTTQ